MSTLPIVQAHNVTVLSVKRSTKGSGGPAWGEELNLASGASSLAEKLSASLSVLQVPAHIPHTG